MSSKRDIRDLDVLIEDIKSKSVINYELIPDPECLLGSLNELKGFVGNAALKKKVVEQTRYILYKLPVLDELSNDDVPSLNTLLDGEPGCGKSMVCGILAGIWSSLGYLRGEPKKPVNIGNIFGGDAQSPADPSISSQLITWFVVTCVLFIIFVLFFGWIIAGLLFRDWRTCKKDGRRCIIFWVIFFFVIYVILLVFFFRVPREKKDRKGNVIVPKPAAVRKNRVVMTKATDWVAGYLGQTESKVKEFLAENKGCVIVIDEAYELASDSRDMFGKKALLIIITSMTEDPRSHVFVMAGYESEMKKLYDMQRGLESRLRWKLKCDKYSPNDLYNIFLLRVSKKGIELEKDNRIRQLITVNAENKFFTDFGRGVRNLVDEAELEYFLDNCEGFEKGGKEPKMKYQHVYAAAITMNGNNRRACQVIPAEEEELV